MKNTLKKIAVCLTALTIALISTVPVYAAQGKWLKSGNRWWYRHPDYSYTSNNWEKISGKWYHFDSDGWMQTGWIKLGGKWYYLNSDGSMQTGWLKYKNKWYCFNKSGAMLTGWVKSGNYYYYLNSNGDMAVDKWVGNYYVDKSGRWSDTRGLDFSREVTKIIIKYGDTPNTAKPVTITDKNEIASAINYFKSLKSADKSGEIVYGGGYTITFVYKSGSDKTASIAACKGSQLMCESVYYNADHKEIEKIYNRNK